ncbi:MAG: Ig-like domain-containing protein [Oscillospiraceae bacterium]|nr:Ig-like domain-containing protein [Oscillospiraceae bacterium]
MKKRRFIASLMAAVMIIGSLSAFGAAQDTAYAGTEMTTMATAETAKVSAWDFASYSDDELAEYNKIYLSDPERKAKVSNNGGKYGDSVIERCYDGNWETHWETGRANSATHQNYVEFTFNEPTTIGRIVYRARVNGAPGKGFPTQFQIYGAETENAEYQLAAEGYYNTVTTNPIVISFTERSFKKLKFVWVKANEDWAAASEFRFYKSDDVKENFLKLFLDGSCSSLAYGVTSEQVEKMAKEAEDYPMQQMIEPYIDAAYNLLGMPGRGENIHEPFTMSQRGNRGTEFNRVASTYQMGGQYDVTGYYAMPGETIGVFANYDPDGPKPRIVFATANQDPQQWYKGYDGVALNIGYNEVVCTGMKGCQLIYLYNPALPADQAFAPVARIVGGTEYPVYRYNAKNPDASEDSDAFYKRLEEYCKQVGNIDAKVEAGEGKYNVCELVSDRIVLTTSARGALKGLQTSASWDGGQGALWTEGDPKRVYHGAKDVMELWDQMMREEYAHYMGYDTTDFNHEDAEPHPAFLWRIYTHGAGWGWAQSIYAAINALGCEADESWWDDSNYSSFTRPSTIFNAEWGTYHEIGHVYDSGLIGTPESTNNLYALMGSMKYIGKSRMDNENRWYNHFQTGINTGVFPDDDLLFYPGGTVFQLEAVDFSKTALYKDITSNYGRAARYARLHRNELNGLTKDEKLIVSMSMGAGVDLSAHFASYGHVLGAEAKWILKDLPKETRPIWFANGRTYHGGAFSEDLKQTEPKIKGAIAGESTGTVVLSMDETVYVGEDGSDTDLQCYSISRQDITTPGAPVPAEPEFIGITGDNFTTAINELYIFEDKNVVPGHTYEYTVTAYDCSLEPADKSATVRVTIPEAAMVPVYWIDINHGQNHGATLTPGGEGAKIQLDYRPLNTTYDFSSAKWEYDENLVEVIEDPEYKGDPTHKIVRAIANGTSTTIKVRVGGNNDPGYGYNEDGSLKTGPQLTATFNVNFNHAEIPMTGITLEPSTLKMLKGETTQLKAKKQPAGATTTSKFAWRSMDVNIAQVDDNGNITAVGVGETDIKVSIIDSVAPNNPTPPTPGDEPDDEGEGVNGYFWKLCHVKVEGTIEPDSITIDSWEPTEDGKPVLYPGERCSKHMTITFHPEDAYVNPDAVKWEVVRATTNNSAYADYVEWFPPASFDYGYYLGSGVLFGLYDGTVVVRASYDTTEKTIYSDELEVIVKSEDEIPPTPVPTEVPKATQTPQPQPQTTPNPKALRNVSINHTSYTLNGVNSTVELELSPNPSEADGSENVKWISSNSAIATVTAVEDEPTKAIVTAASPGTVEITGTWSGKSAVCRVTVNTDVKLEGLYFKDKNVGQSMEKTLIAGDSYQLILYPKPTNATGIGETTWESKNPDVATVDKERGLVTAVAPGTAVITGSVPQTIGGETVTKTLTCTITVKAKEIPLTGVSISQATHRMTPAESLTLTLSPRPANANTGLSAVRWESSDTAVAAVDANGHVTAKADGTAVITGTMGEFSQSCTVVVDTKLAEVIPDENNKIVHDDKNFDAAIGFKTGAIPFNTSVADLAWVLKLKNTDDEYGVKINTTITGGSVIFGLIVTGSEEWLNAIEKAELRAGVTFGDTINTEEIFGKSENSRIIE